MDPHLRKLERAAARGDEAAARRLAAAQLRTRTEPAWRALLETLAPRARLGPPRSYKVIGWLDGGRCLALTGRCYTSYTLRTYTLDLQREALLAQSDLEGARSPIADGHALWTNDFESLYRWEADADGSLRQTSHHVLLNPTTEDVYDVDELLCGDGTTLVAYADADDTHGERVLSVHDLSTFELVQAHEDLVAWAVSFDHDRLAWITHHHLYRGSLRTLGAVRKPLNELPDPVAPSFSTRLNILEDGRLVCENNLITGGGPIVANLLEPDVPPPEPPFRLLPSGALLHFHDLDVTRLRGVARSHLSVPKRWLPPRSRHSSADTAQPHWHPHAAVAFTPGFLAPALLSREGTVCEFPPELRPLCWSPNGQALIALRCTDDPSLGPIGALEVWTPGGRPLAR